MISSDGIFLMPTEDSLKASFILDKSLERSLATNPVINKEILFSGPSVSPFAKTAYSSTALFDRFFPELDVPTLSILDLEASPIDTANIVEIFKEAIQEGTEFPLDTSSGMKEFIKLLVVLYESLPGSDKYLPCTCLVPPFPLILGSYFAFELFEIFVGSVNRTPVPPFEGYLKALNSLSVKSAFSCLNKEEEYLDGYKKILGGLYKDTESVLTDSSLSDNERKEKIVSWFFPKALEEITVPLIGDLMGYCPACSASLEISLDEKKDLPLPFPVGEIENYKASELLDFVRLLNKAIKTVEEEGIGEKTAKCLLDLEKAAFERTVRDNFMRPAYLR